MARVGRPKMENKEPQKRFQLVLHTDLYEEIVKISESECTSILDATKRVLKYGLLIISILKNPDAKLIVREKGVEREIIIV